MTEKRTISYPRKKRRYLVEFSIDGVSCTGFSNDLSASGMFVRSARLPNPGTRLTLTLHLPGNKRTTLSCQVVRTHRVPGGLSTVRPNGFAVRIGQAPEEYFQLLATL
jgi:hypothetical protein